MERQLHALSDLNKQTAKRNISFFQAKLAINTPGDAYEKEADAMAEHVMRIPANEPAFFSPKPISISSLQRKGNSPGINAPNSIESYLNKSNSNGKNLDQSTRNFFEAKFGYDFSNVKIHNDAAAAKSAQSINALAYTTGNDIVFNKDQFSPNSDNGKKLLAHELTHVVQQTGERSNGETQVMRQQKPEDEFKSCSNNQQALIEPVINDARKAVDKATAAAATSWGRPDKINPTVKQLFLDHFHTVSRGDIRDILGKYVSLGISFDKGIKVKCEATCDKDKNSATCGYAYNTQWFGGHGPVHICFDPAGCNFTSSSKNNQVALIIHEAAHRYTGVDDKAYRWETTKYNALTPGQAMDNADSYAWFATLL
jgi:hypothetical protein